MLPFRSHFKGEAEWQLPLLPQILSVFKETPTLEAESEWQLPYYPNYRLFLERPHPHSVFIQCACYSIRVLIPIKSIVLRLFLPFITLSNLYYPHHPPSKGCTYKNFSKYIKKYILLFNLKFKPHIMMF